MNFNSKYIILSAMCALLLVSCGPKKHEEKPPAKKEAVKPPAPEEKPDTMLEYPEHPGEPLTPEGKKLEIEEDNVMNPLPG